MILIATFAVHLDEQEKTREENKTKSTPNDNAGVLAWFISVPCVRHN